MDTHGLESILTVMSEAAEAPHEYVTHVLGLLVAELARLGDGLEPRPKASERALAGMRSLVDARVLCELCHHAAGPVVELVPFHSETAEALRLIAQWTGVHLAALRQLRLLLNDWTEPAPKAGPDIPVSRLAPEVALGRLCEVAREWRGIAARKAGPQERQQLWEALCRALQEGAGYSATLLNALAADVLHQTRFELARLGTRPIPVCVPVVGTEMGRSCLAHLEVELKPGVGSVVAFEPEEGFDGSARQAAEEAVQAACAYLGRDRNPGGAAVRLVYPRGICLEGASLGPAVFAGAVLSACEEYTPTLDAGIALLGTLRVVGGTATLGPVGNRPALMAKHAAVPLDMLAVHSNRERLPRLADEERAPTAPLESLDDLWRLLGPRPAARVDKAKSDVRVPFSARPVRRAWVMLALSLIVATVVTWNQWEHRAPVAPAEQTMPTTNFSDQRAAPTSSAGLASAVSNAADAPASASTPQPADPPAESATPAGVTESAGASGMSGAMGARPTGAVPLTPQEERSPVSQREAAEASSPVPPTPLIPKDIDPVTQIQVRIACQNNLRLLARAFLVYTVDWDQKLPPYGRWVPATYRYVLGDPNLYACPKLPGRWGYAMNQNLCGVCLATVHDIWNTPLLFDSSVNAPSASGDLRWVGYPHMEGANVALIDGRVRWYPAGGVPNLR